jgi:hypothetical protein
MEKGPKKTALWLLIGSVVVSALLGIWAIVSGEFGELQARVLLTTLTITGASVCGLACGAYWETGRGRALPALGTLLAIVGAGFLIFGIWYKTSGMNYWKVSASICLMAIATAHICLLSLARLAPRFRWALVAAYLFTYLLAGMFIYVLFRESSNERLFRVIGVVAILLAAVSLIVPIFHRMGAAELSAAASGTAPRCATITCPSCGAELANSINEISCDSCGCVFKVSILRERLREGLPYGDAVKE